MLRLVPSTQTPQPKPKQAPLAELLPPGRLVELSGHGACARTSTAVSLVVHAQAQREPVGWVQSVDGPLYPPDLDEAGVDLDELITIRVPQFAGPIGLVQAAEWLLRSGAFGLVVVDLSDQLPSGLPARWQGRLSGLVRKYNARLCLITHSDETEASCGPLIGLRIAVKRDRIEDGTFLLRPQVLKDKVGLFSQPQTSLAQPPPGFQ